MNQKRIFHHLIQEQKIGRNDSCPCGSGGKYI
ncbi:SEC-C metal-binding domain-containing protein [Cytobacillus kochii]